VVPAKDQAVKGFIKSMDDWEDRAKFVISLTEKVGCFCSVTPRDILEAENERLTIAFLADIMRVRHGLPVNSSTSLNSDTPAQEVSVKKATTEDKAHIEKQEEESQLCTWINGLGLDLGFEVKNLETDLSDGVVLLKILAKAKPEFVDSKKYAQKPKTKFAMLALLNYVLDLAKNQFKFPDTRLVASEIAEAKKGNAVLLVKQIKKFMGGSDIDKKSDPKKKSQVLKRMASSSTAKDLFVQSRIKSTSNEDLLEWINSKITAFRPGVKISSLTDPQLDIAFLLDLVSAVLPAGSVDRSLIASGSSEENKLKNASMLLGLVWRAGVPVSIHPKKFLSPDLDTMRTFASSLLVHLSNKVTLK